MMQLLPEPCMLGIGQGLSCAQQPLQTSKDIHGRVPSLTAAQLMHVSAGLFLCTSPRAVSQPERKEAADCQKAATDCLT